ncbi:hypothetical protein DFH06DRAFT_376781 [Mycena polygramma]|nr:hypothetical protein DFH06DRAFT_376781 [Mycena polygramma]
MPRAPKSCANPLFYAWVEEFHDEKDYRKRGGPPRATGYENALRSIAACTTKYAHPKELLVLTGVGPTCVERLTDKLEVHCARRGTPMPEFKKKERAKKAPAAPKKVVRRNQKVQEEEEAEDSDEDFPRPSTSKKARSTVQVSDDDQDDEGEYTGQKEARNPPSAKTRTMPARRASAKRAVPVLEVESSEDDY